MPLFHAAALYTFIFMVIYFETPVILGISDRPLSPDLVVDCLNNMDAELVALSPSILEEMSQSEEYLAPLRKLKLVVFGGGTCDPLLRNTLFTYFSREFGSRSW